MSKKSNWAEKVLALIHAKNTDAAIAQIKVAPTAKDLSQLRGLLTKNKLLSHNPVLAAALEDHMALLSAPRLHRSP